MSSDPPAAPAKVSLTKFLDENQRTIAVLGVFLALAIYWNNQPLRPISSFISFMCFAITIPMFVEVFRNYVNTVNRSWNLIIFANFFQPILLYSLWFFLVSYRANWESHMFSLVFWVILIPIAILYSRMKVMRAMAVKLVDWNKNLVTWLFLRNKVEFSHATTDEVEKAIRITTRGLSVFFMLVLISISLDASGLASKRINRHLAGYYAKYQREDSPTESHPTPQQTTIVLFPIQVTPSNSIANPTQVNGSSNTNQAVP